MAVYTEISSEELEKVLSEYSLGSLEHIKGIAEGVENTNYLLKTDKSKYIFTIYEKRVSRNELPFFLGLMEHLSSRNIPCPVPVRGKDGKVLREIKGRPCSIVSFLEGNWPRNITTNHCFEVGKIMAQMHLASGDFSLQRKNTMSVDAWDKMASETIPHADEVAVGMADEIKTALMHVSISWPANLPSGVIHADLFPDNIFFKNNKLSGILDFYFACNDFYAYDLAIALNAWCFEHREEFNITKAKAMLHGYNEIKPFTEEELESLPVLACGAALRFLLSRLYDWINKVDGAMVTPKDPMEYLKKLRFHMRIKNHREYGL